MAIVLAGDEDENVRDHGDACNHIGDGCRANVGCSNNPPVDKSCQHSEQACAVIWKSNITCTCNPRIGFWSGACSKTGMDKVSPIDGLV